MGAGIGAFFQGLASGAQTGMQLHQQQQRLALEAKAQERADKLASLQERQIELQQQLAQEQAASRSIQQLGQIIAIKNPKARRFLADQYVKKLSGGEMDGKSPQGKALIGMLDAMEDEDRAVATAMVGALGGDSSQQTLQQLQAAFASPDRVIDTFTTILGLRKAQGEVELLPLQKQQIGAQTEQALAGAEANRALALSRQAELERTRQVQAAINAVMSPQPDGGAPATPVAAPTAGAPAIGEGTPAAIGQAKTLRRLAMGIMGLDPEMAKTMMTLANGIQSGDVESELFISKQKELDKPIPVEVARDLGVPVGMTYRGLASRAAGGDFSAVLPTRAEITEQTETAKRSVETRFPTQPLPSEAQKGIISAFDTMRALGDLERNLDKTGRVRGALSEAKLFFGIGDQGEIDFETARNNLRVAAQGIIKGIPSNFDIETFISTMPKLFAPESVNKSRIKFIRETVADLLKGTIAFYKGSKNIIPEAIVTRAGEFGIDVGSVKAWDGNGDPLDPARRRMKLFLNSSGQREADESLLLGGVSP